MVDTNKINITKLNNSNYQIWKYKIELLLIKDGVWDVVREDVPPNPTTAWKRKDDRARATIGLLVEDNQFIHIKKATTSNQSWAILKNRHEKPSLTNKVSLLKRICNLKMTETDDMEEHINKMTDLVEQLANLGEELAENLVVAMLLRSLPDSYDSLINALENRPEEDLNSAFIIGKLNDEYTKRMESSTENHLENSVLKIYSNDVKPKICTYCEKPGHLKSNYYAFKKELKKQKEVEKQKDFDKEKITTKFANIICAEGDTDEDGYDFLF